MPERQQIGLFFKAPIPGQVKTRLAPRLGAEGAAELYAAFLEDTIDVCRSVPGAELVLFDGSREPAALPASTVGLACYAQEGDDLGERMTRALETLLSRGAERAVLVGSDAPTMPASRIEGAFAALEDSDMVLGPTPDGGYCLIGVRRRPGKVLAGIAWSTRTVLAETRAGAARCGWSASKVDGWYDVDTGEDLDNLIREIQSPEGPGAGLSGSRTRSALVRMGLSE